MSKTLQRRKQSKRGRHGLLPMDGKVYSYITDIPRTPSFGNGPFTVSKNYIVLSWHTTNAAISTFNSVSMSLNQIDDYAQLTTVFDQYRLDAVEVFITNQGTNLNITNTGRLITCLDFDDDTVLTTLGQAEDYSTAVTSSCQSSQYRHFVPRMAMAAYGGGVFTSFTNVEPQWIDAASPAVLHYGLKLAASVTSTAMVFDLQVRFKVSFRMIR
jgi:hypothetical protein